MRERAVSAILSALPFASLGLGLVLRVPGVSYLARSAYDALARRRHEVSSYLGLGVCGVRLDRRAGAEAPTPAAEPKHLWQAVVHPAAALREVLVILALVMTTNQILLDNDWARRRFPKATQPLVFQVVMDRLRLYQGWRMFAPEPPYDDGRMVVDARTVDGRKVDPFTGEPPDFDPETPVGWGHSQLWCDYHLKMFFARYSANRQHLQDYLQSWHNRTGHDRDRLVAFDVWWVSDKSPGPGEAHGKPQKPVLLTSVGKVTDSGATPWLDVGEPTSKRP